MAALPKDVQPTPQHNPGIVPHGANRHEYQAGGRRVAVFDRIEDAHLFSASRDLLAALQVVRAAINCHYDPLVIDKEYGAQIDAAIAKVGGQLPGPISIAEELDRR